RLTTSSILSAAVSVPRLVAAIDRHAPDVVLSIQEHVSVALAAAASLSRRRPRVVLGVQNNPAARGEHLPTWMRHPLGRACRRAYERADRIVALSHGVAGGLASE